MLVVFSLLFWRVLADPLASSDLNAFGFVYSPNGWSMLKYCWESYAKGSTISARDITTSFFNTSMFLIANGQVVRNYCLLYPNMTRFLFKNQRDLNIWEVDKIGRVNPDDDLWLGTPDTARLVCNSTFSAVNDCLTSYYNIINGVFCYLTSNQVNLTSMAVNRTSKWRFSFPANSTLIGNSLTTCIPVIDLYCSMQFGVSVVSNSLPFGVTFDLGDGNLDRDWCLRVKGLNECSLKNNTKCNETLARLLTDDLLFTNYIPFIPTSNYIGILSEFIAGNVTFKNLTDFLQNNTVEKQKLRQGVRLFSSNNDGLWDFIGMGLISGASSQNFIKMNQEVTLRIASMCLVSLLYWQ